MMDESDDLALEKALAKSAQAGDPATEANNILFRLVLNYDSRARAAIATLVK